MAFEFVKNVTGILAQTQDKINRQFLKRIEALEKLVGGSSDGIVKDVNSLKTTVGDNNSGLVKDTAALKTTVGDSTAGLVKKVTDVETAIGDEDHPASILGRIKALEEENQ